MHRKRMTRFLAGILSALLVMTSSGMEQMVFAAEPETEVLQEETVVEADDTETSEEEVEAPEETVDAEDAEEENPEEQPDEAEAEEPSPEETDGDSATDADQTETLPETAEANIQAAQDKTAVTSAESNFTYRKDSGKAIITGYTGTDSTVVIPSSIDGFEVTEIAGGAFRSSTMESVTFPDTLTWIGDSAFAKCDSLTEVRLPATDKFKHMGTYAFENCANLKKIWVPEDFKPSYMVAPFYQCAQLKEVEFEEGITEIPSSLMKSCPGIESIVIPDTVTTIGSEAFSNCENLKSVTLPSNLTEIRYEAFKKCTSLQKVEFPEGLKTIGTSAFSSCKTLTEVRLPRSLKEAGSYSFEDCTGITSVWIPKGITKAYNTFEYCSNLKTVEFEEGIESIPERLFGDCTGLESIIIPETVTQIEKAAFRDCTNLTSVILPENLKGIQADAFYMCKNLKTTNIPEKVEELGEAVFRGCESLTTVYIPNSVTTMGSNMFSGCTSLKTVHLPEAYTEIPEYTFYNCDKLSDVNIPAGVEKIGHDAFYNCDALTELDLPEGLVTIQSEAFKNCDGLTHVVLPDSVKNLSGQAFSTCSNLESVVLGNGVTDVSFSVFAHCGKLRFVVLSCQTEYIGQYAFIDDTALTEILIPQSVTEMDSEAFRGITGLTICGVKGSYAETYANKYGFTFEEQEVKAEKVTLTPAKMTINKGQEKGLTLTVSPAGVTDTVIWKSSNPSVAKVTADGFVRGIDIGTAKIEATVGGKKASCTVTVVQPTTGLSLDKNSLELEREDTYQFKVTIQPKNASQVLKWNSSAPSIAEVDEKGFVTAKKEGHATITVKTTDGSGIYRTCSVTVTAPQFTVSSVPDQTFTGAALKPQVQVYAGNSNKLLTAGKDYTVAYKNNTKAGTAQVIVKGKGSYKKTVTKNFTILPKDMEDGSVEVKPIADCKYTGKDCNVKVTVTWGKKTLKSGTDYTVDYQNNREVDTAQSAVHPTVVITGKDNYKGTLTKEFHIYRTAASAFAVAPVEKQDYTGTELKPELIVYASKKDQKNGNAPLIKGLDYIVSYDKNVTAGTAKAKISGIGEYGGQKTISFTIQKKSLKADQADITLRLSDPTEKLIYTGIAQKPDVIVTYRGTKLTPGTDYTVKYTNNVKAGEGEDGNKKSPTVTITGKGNYTGSRSIVFSIGQRSLHEDEIKVVVSPAKYNKGKPVKAAVKITDGKKTLKAGTDYTVDYKNNTAPVAEDAEDAPTAVITGKGNYTGVINKIFTIYVK